MQYVFGYCKVKVGDVIHSLHTGLNPRTNFKLNSINASCPYITGKDIYNNKINFTDKTDKITLDDVNLINKRSKLEDGILLFASTGCGTVGRMAIIDKYTNDWNVSETMYCIKTEGIIITKYLMYILYSSNIKKQYENKISKGTVPHLKVSDLLNLEFILPSLEEQQRIVTILDSFDSLCDDISSGLPAEIEARQKQYEYYRDRLLGFKNINE